MSEVYTWTIFDRRNGVSHSCLPGQRDGQVLSEQVSMSHDCSISTDTRGRTQNDEQVWRTRKDKEHSQPHRSFALTRSHILGRALPGAGQQATLLDPFSHCGPSFRDISFWYNEGSVWGLEPIQIRKRRNGKIKKLKTPENEEAQDAGDEFYSWEVCLLLVAIWQALSTSGLCSAMSNKQDGFLFSCITDSKDAFPWQCCDEATWLFFKTVFWVSPYGCKVVVSTLISIYSQSRKKGREKWRKKERRCLMQMASILSIGKAGVSPEGPWLTQLVSWHCCHMWLGSDTWLIRLLLQGSIGLHPPLQWMSKSLRSYTDQSGFLHRVPLCVRLWQPP